MAGLRNGLAQQVREVARPGGLGPLTSGDLRELVEGRHGLQLVGVHLGCLALQVPGFDLLPGPWHTAVEDTAQGDDYEESRVGLAGAGARTPREWHPHLRCASV